MEHDAIDNGTPRVQYEDLALNVSPEAAADEPAPAEDAAPAEPVKTYTVAVIKPDSAASEEQVTEIFAAIAESGLKVAQQDDVDFDADAAKKLVGDVEGADDAAAGITGKCKVLVLSAVEADATQLWQKLMEPVAEDEDKVEGAEAEAAEGAEPAEDPAAMTKAVMAQKYSTAIYASASAEQAMAQIDQLFPDFAKTVAAPADTQSEAEAGPAADDAAAANDASADAADEVGADAAGDAAAPADAEEAGDTAVVNEEAAPAEGAAAEGESASAEAEEAANDAAADDGANASAADAAPAE